MDRPREKMIANKARTMSDSELLAIVLGKGYEEFSALDLAREILGICKQNLQELSKLTAKDLMRFKGIGLAKATAIESCFELARRVSSRNSLERQYLRNSKEAADYIRPLLVDYHYEVFGVLYLMQSGWIKTFEVMSEGGITSTTVDPRLVFKRAFQEGAVSLIIFHNHPSGSLKPSKADESLTRKLNEGAKFMDIKLLDHIILGDKGYYSFADEGILSWAA